MTCTAGTTRRSTRPSSESRRLGRSSSLTLLCLSRGGVGVEPGSVGGGEVVVAVLSAFEAADGGGGGVELLGGVGEGEAEGVS